MCQELQKTHPYISWAHTQPRVQTARPSNVDTQLVLCSGVQSHCLRWCAAWWRTSGWRVKTLLVCPPCSPRALLRPLAWLCLFTLQRESELSRCSGSSRSFLYTPETYLSTRHNEPPSFPLALLDIPYKGETFVCLKRP